MELFGPLHSHAYVFLKTGIKDYRGCAVPPTLFLLPFGSNGHLGQFRSYFSDGLKNTRSKGIDQNDPKRTPAASLALKTLRLLNAFLRLDIMNILS